MYYNVLWKKCRQREIEADVARRILEDFRRFLLQISAQGTMFRGVLAPRGSEGQGGLSVQGLNRIESGAGLGSGYLESCTIHRRWPNAYYAARALHPEPGPMRAYSSYTPVHSFQTLITDLAPIVPFDKPASRARYPHAETETVDLLRLSHPEGAAHSCIIRSYLATLRKQSRDVFESLVLTFKDEHPPGHRSPARPFDRFQMA
ncbi:MAG: hypothetical protein ACREYC_21520 [Gammaproteobacteria bacterium]